MNSAIILAGGNGTRMDSNIPKQFLVLNDKMLIQYSVDQFVKNKNIDEIIIVSCNDWIQKLKYIYNNISIIKGGTSRISSSIKGLLACNKMCQNVLIHDAARPLISQKIINKSLNLIQKYDAVIPAIDFHDSLLNKTNMRYLDRTKIKKIQTPQSFKYNLILNAYKKLSKKNNQFTDDLSVLLNFNNKVSYKIFKGDKYNFKITTSFEFNLLKNILYEN